MQPIIFDTDYGPFIDDGKIISCCFIVYQVKNPSSFVLVFYSVFATGLLLNSGDLLDLKFVVTTSENPLLSAKCVAKHLDLAGRSDIPVGAGQQFPPYKQRGGVCAVPGLVGFALESVCSDIDLPIHENGTEAIAKMIMESGRNDWWYIVVTGQSTLKALVDSYPVAASKIDTLIVMGGDWCSGFEPYPDVLSPVDETNIACDPAAANDVLDASVSPFSHIYYVPVVMADTIAGKDYMKIVDAAESGTNAGAAATMDFYRAWTKAGRANSSLLIHLEAEEYDPEKESVPQFDSCAVMLALELLDDENCEDRVELFKFHGVHFYEAGEGVTYPGTPRTAFSLHTGEEIPDLPDQCPSLTPFTFELEDTTEKELPVMVALGYKSVEAKNHFFADMAARMAGEQPNCSSNRST